MDFGNNEEDYYNSDNEDDYSYNSDDGSYHMEVSDSKADAAASNHTVLTNEEIRHRQENDITEVSTVLSVSSDEAIILLIHGKWRVIDAYNVFSDDRARETIGLSNPNPNPNPNSFFCSICFEWYRRDKFFAAACGHPFCGECWGGYMKASIGDGAGCLSLRCPQLKCSVAVGESMIKLLATEQDKEKYSYYLVRSYVESSKVVKWCPAAGCENAVRFDVGTEGGGSDVTCLCSNRFCWSCGEDAHRPLDCSTVEKWMIKNSNEAQNTTWIMANCKPCPKCKRQIEKNDGCMHMTCSQGCKFEFCWLCLGAWSKHGSKTGGYYSCNIYQAEKDNGTLNEDELRRKMARKSIQKYTHYYDRWLSNHNSRKKALVDMETVKLEELSEIQCETMETLKIVMEAWKQIVESRRVLKWSYAYGYYLNNPEDEVSGKKEFFEYLQGEAESWLEKLHECAEKELNKYLDMDNSCSSEFHGFKIKLKELTNATKGYFEKLVTGLENGLLDR